MIDEKGEFSFEVRSVKWLIVDGPSFRIDLYPFEGQHNKLVAGGDLSGSVHGEIVVLVHLKCDLKLSNFHCVHYNLLRKSMTLQ